MNPLSQRVERVLGIVAAVLLPLGIALIVLGWYGAAHSPYLWEQVPYLISGGLVGLGLVMGAGLVYLGSWVARGAQAQRAASAELAELLREIRDGLGTAPRSSSTNGHLPTFVATARGSMWHRADCSAVVGRTDVRVVGPDGDGLAPCGLCDPLSALPRQVSLESN